MLNINLTQNVQIQLYHVKLTLGYVKISTKILTSTSFNSILTEYIFLCFFFNYYRERKYYVKYFHQV